MGRTHLVSCVATLSGCSSRTPAELAALEFGGGGRAKTIPTFVAEEQVLATTYAAAVATFGVSLSEQLRLALRDTVLVYDADQSSRVHLKETENPFRLVPDSSSAKLVLQPRIQVFRLVDVASTSQAIFGTWGQRGSRTGVQSTIKISGRRPGALEELFAVTVKTPGIAGYDSEAEAIQMALDRLSTTSVTKLLR